MTDGERMRRRREDKEMSLRELAERTLLDYAFLSRVENNLRTLTLPQAKVVARAVGVKPPTITELLKYGKGSDRLKNKVCDVLRIDESWTSLGE